MYLIDANVLIRADADFYPLDRIPQFWEWLVAQGSSGNVKMPAEIHEEIANGNDDLAGWVKETHVKEALLLREEIDPTVVQKVLEHGYQYSDPLFSETDIQRIGRDAFLIAYAMDDPARTIVTRETSASSKKRGNRKVPDACDGCGIGWTSDYEMYRLLDFRL
jgi:hypothetical protein